MRWLLARLILFRLVVPRKGKLILVAFYLATRTSWIQVHKPLAKQDSTLNYLRAQRTHTPGRMLGALC